jgi:hypothetical protein
MIENTSNPESGIDQFLASQRSETMSRELGEEFEKEAVLGRARISELERQLEWAKTAREEYGTKLDKVRSFIQNSIDNGDWTDEELEEIFWEELSEILDLEIMKEIEVRITAEWTATLKMKRGQELSDIEITVEEPEISRFASGELSDVYESELTVDER